ncbi:MAG: MATE family efflux transporter, partial [Atopostipes sp.]|nr:MATE family efflux transporter [Atopostipes sp.]
MNSKLELMKNGNIKKALLSLGLPTIIGLLMTGFYNFIDSYFVAQLGTEAMGAISITYPLITLIPGFALLFGNGAAAFISKLLGSNENEQAEYVLASTMTYVFAFSILIQGSLFFLAEILTALGASKAVLPYALDYSKILFISFLFHIPSVALMNLVRAEGAIALSTASQIVGAVLNIVLDPLLIFKLDMGIEGAALATAIAQFVSFSMLISYYLFDYSILKISLDKVKIKKWIILPILKVGIPLFAINFFQSTALGLANKFASSYGDTSVAALGIVNRVIGMSTFAITGFSRGYQTLISYNYGANNMERVKEATKTAMIWSILGAIGLSAVQIFFSSGIVNAFSDNGLVISKGMTAMFGGSIFFWTYGFQAIGVILLLSIGRNASGFIFSIARQGLIFIPSIFILNYFMGEMGVFYEQGIADLITTLLLMGFLYS